MKLRADRVRASPTFRHHLLVVALDERATTTKRCSPTFGVSDYELVKLA